MDAIKQKRVRAAARFIMLLAALLLGSCGTTPRQQGPNSIDAGIRKVVDVDHRGMTAEERDRADQARRLFEVGTASVRSADAAQPVLSAENKKIVDDWLRIKKKYAGVKTFNTVQAVEIGQVMAAMTRAAELEYRSTIPYQVNRENNSLVIAPHSGVAMHVSGHCMDPGIGAPGAGDKFQLVAIERLIDPELVPLYHDLIAYYAQHPEQSTQIQAIIWAIRKGCFDTHQIDRLQEEHLKILNAAHQDGAQVLIDHFKACHGAGNRFVRGLLNNLMGEFARTQASFGNVQDELNRLLTLPTTGSIPKDNSDFTLLGPGIVAHATGEGPLKAKIEIINLSDNPFVFEPAKYAAETQRPTQRVALVLPTLLEDMGLHEVRSHRVMEAYLNEAARFFHDKTLEKSSSSTGIGKLFTALLGREIQSPVIRTLLNATPLIGNSISLYEAVEGKNWFTGDLLSPAERFLALMSSVPGVGTIERLFPGAIQSGLLRTALETIEKTEPARDVASWAIGNTVDEFLGAYSPKKYVDKQTDRLGAMLAEAARYSVAGLRAR